MGAGAVAPVHHHPAPRPRPPPRLTTPARLGEVASLQYAKVAEYQLRGAVHFHALVRLDGPAGAEGSPRPRPRSPPPCWPPWSRRPPPPCVHRPTGPRRRPRPGTERSAPRSTPGPSATDRRTDDPDRSLTPEQVAGYLAKYATKAADDTEAKDNAHLRRLRAATARHSSTGPRRHPPTDADRERAVRAARQVGAHARLPGPLRHQVPPLLGHPRPAPPRPAAVPGPDRRGQPGRRRIDLRQLERPPRRRADETTVVIGSWVYAGSGWANDGETALAVAAAARAREHAQERAQRRRRRTVGE